MAFKELPLCMAVVGVGQYCAAARRPLRGSSATLPRFSPSVALGVGHMPLAFAAFRELLPPSSPVVRGVGQKRTQRSSDTDLLVSGFNVSVDVLLRSIWSCAVGVGMLWVGDDPYPVP